MPTIGSEIDLQFDVLSTDIKEVKSGLSTFKEETEIKTENIDADLDSLENKVNKSNTELVVEITKLKEYSSNQGSVIADLISQMQKSDFAYNIEQGGCVPNDPNFDNGPVLTQIFDQVGRTIFCPVFVPAKDYYVKTTAIATRVGGAITGMGGGIHFGEQPSIRGGVSRLIWNGTKGGNVVELRNQGMYWRGVTVHGGLDPAKRAGRGIWIRENAGFGIATGDHQFDSTTVLYCDVGVDFGTGGGANAEVSSFNTFRTVYCGTGLRTSSGQTLGISIVNYQPFGTPLALDFAAGGRHTVMDLDIVSAGTAIRIADPGSGNCTYNFHGVAIDGAVKDGDVVLLDLVSDWKPSNVFITGLHRSSVHKGKFTANIRGGSVTTFQSCYDVPKIEFAGKTPNVRLRSCTLAVKDSPLELVNVNSPGKWTFGWDDGCVQSYDKDLGYAGKTFGSRIVTSEELK